jgi:type VI secretion system protein ImpK
MRLVALAVVALLDEVALHSRQSALSDWSRYTLQEEMFGGHLGGEWFFQNAEQLLARQDTPTSTDVMEVYLICLLLGFRGKFGHDTGALHALVSRLSERVQRQRSTSVDLAPHWRPRADVAVGPDRWIRRLTVGLALSILFVVLLWGISTITLRGSLSELDQMASRASGDRASNAQ